MKIGYLILLFIIGFNSCCFAADNYKVEKVVMKNHYIINGSHWKMKGHCAAFHKGDKVTFVKGNANGKCVSATVLHQKSNSTCNLWCFDDRSDG
ncbi:MAG: hypothetical protein AB7V32_02850 [Candidatus Berkiella sp.]